MSTLIVRSDGVSPETSCRSAIAGFSVIATLAAIYYLWRIPIRLEVAYNESWNAWHALRWAAGEPLYPDPRDLVIANYPPLSFVLVGGLTRLGADPVFVGRVLSCISVPVIGLSAASVVHDLGGRRLAAALAATWCMAALLTGFSTYVGTNEPSLLSVAVMSVGFALFARAERRSASLMSGLAVMLLAGFIKHNLVAIPFSALAWVWSTRPLRPFLPTIAAGLAAVAGLGLCVALWGRPFVDQMMMPRTMSLARAVSSLETPPWLAVMFAIGGLMTVRREPRDRVIFLLIGTSVCSFFLQRAGDGVSKNAQLELVFAAAVGLGMASDHLCDFGLGRRGRILVVLGLALVFAKEAWSFAVGPFRLPLSATFRADIAARDATFAAEVRRVAALPDTTVCHQMSVCLRAGKPFLYDPFGVHSFLVTGWWTQTDVDASIARRGLVFIENDPRAVWPHR